MEKVLIVDDDADTRSILSDILKSEGYRVITAEDGKRALEEVGERSPQVVLLDVRLPEMDGMQVLQKIKKIHNNTVVIMLTAYGGIKDAVQAVQLGAFNYITKPFDNEEVLLNIKKALQIRQLSLHDREPRSSTDMRTSVQFVGKSPAIREVLNQVDTVSPTIMTVILQGESGTGKELIARMIHQASPRHDGPFVVVDGGTLPENLIESELFGYERGAFTGASEKKTGKFESAAGGTIFLDEITNLPYQVQAKLLRVLQERKIHHLGSSKEIKIDVRIIAATNTLLTEEFKKKRFRDDLYHRLNEFIINLPPLRNRQEDIPLLTSHFLKEANREFHKEIKRISDDAMKSLLIYHWPGNLRELRNTVKRAALLANSDTLREKDFCLTFPFSGRSVAGTIEDNTISLASLDTEISMEKIVRKITADAEKELITNALIKTKNNKTKAAKLLQIDRMTLYSKMKSFKL